MIELNLLKKRWETFHKRLVFIRFISLYFLGLFFLLIVFGINYLTNNTVISRIKSKIEKIQKDLMSDKASFEKLKSYKIKSNLLVKKLSFYNDEIADRIIWTDKLIIISESMPYGMWLWKVSYRKDYEMGKKEKFLIIEGFISPEITKPRKAISFFMENLRKKGDGVFEEIFLRRVRSEKFEGRKVYHFEIECKLKGKSEDERMVKVS